MLESALQRSQLHSRQGRFDRALSDGAGFLRKELSVAGRGLRNASPYRQYRKHKYEQKKQAALL